MALLALAASLALGSSTAARAADSLWTFRAASDVCFFHATLPGAVVVGTDSALTGLDPASGAALWTRRDLAGLSAAGFDLVPASPFALIHRPAVRKSGARLELLDVQTGRTRWDSDSLPVQVPRGEWFLPERRMLLVLSVPPSWADSNDTHRGVSRLFEESSNSNKMENDPGPWRVVAVDIETGTVRWESRDWFTRAPATFRVVHRGRGFHRRTLDSSRPTLSDSDSTLILYASDDGPVQVDLRDGKVRWRAGGAGKGSWRVIREKGVAPPMLLEDGTLYVANGKRVMALSTGDGHLLWKRPAKLRTHVVQLEHTPRGLLVRPGRRCSPT
jgi:outer membrane protein assembly factor BamB